MKRGRHNTEAAEETAAKRRKKRKRSTAENNERKGKVGIKKTKETQLQRKEKYS